MPLELAEASKFKHKRESQQSPMMQLHVYQSRHLTNFLRLFFLCRFNILVFLDGHGHYLGMNRAPGVPQYEVCVHVKVPSAPEETAT